MNTQVLHLVLLVVGIDLPGRGEPTDPEHAALLKIRSGLVEAYNKRDVDGILALCHPKIVCTWQNAEVTEGREGVRKYYDKMMTGPNRIVESMTADPTVDQLAIIYNGDTAISRGKMNDHYKLTDGSEFGMDSRWSATLVKEGDTWLITNFHASVGAFDNPLLRFIVGKAALWAGLASAAGAALVTFLITWFVMRRKRTAAVGLTP